MSQHPLDFHELHLFLPRIEKAIGYSFVNKKWLLEAFLHRSYLNEAKERLDIGCNERLEFLGDSLLHILVSRFLFEHFPTLQEGELSRLRSQIVDAQTCSRWIEKLQLFPFLLLGKGQRLCPRIFSLEADLFEAVLAALYLDGNWQAVEPFFKEHCQEDLFAICAKPQRNFKAELQDLFQKKRQITPQYNLLRAEGPDHTKTFEVGVFAQELLLASARGRSKKQAEQEAAKIVLESIENPSSSSLFLQQGECMAEKTPLLREMYKP